MKKILFTILLGLGVVMAFQFTSSEILEKDSTLNPNVEEVLLLELFTSQGCSSCPSADKLLNKTIADNKNVIGLSYHVDYWNYIGWKDPFSSKVYSNYQRAYGSKFKSSSIYTPQLVVNGSSHFTGSDALKLNKKLADKTSYISNAITFKTVETLKENINISLKTESPADLLTVVLVIKERETKIPRGENRNRTLTNTNIVVARDVVSNAVAATFSLKVPDIVTEDDEVMLIAFAQDSSLRVSAAAKYEL
jgi:hypothetical protein